MYSLFIYAFKFIFSWTTIEEGKIYFLMEIRNIFWALLREV